MWARRCGIIHKRVGRNEQTLPVPALQSLFCQLATHENGVGTRGVCAVPANDLRDLVPAYMNHPGCVVVMILGIAGPAASAVGSREGANTGKLNLDKSLVCWGEAVGSVPLPTLSQVSDGCIYFYGKN